MKEEGEYALITGGSNGIGLEFAKIFAKNGINLVLVARNKEKLREIAKELHTNHKVEVNIISKDLSEVGSALEIYNKIKKQGIKINYLINNAGYGKYGKFTENTIEDNTNLINLNIIALTDFTNLFLKDMKKSGGKILNVASLAAFEPGPYMALYYATKAYVLSLSEAISYEENGKVSISTLCPGPTHTGFEKRAHLEKSMMFSNAMNADKVANIGYKGMMKGKKIIIPGAINNLGYFLVKFGPRKVIDKVFKKINQGTISKH